MWLNISPPCLPLQHKGGGLILSSIFLWKLHLFSYWLRGFSSPILDCIRISMSTVFLHARLVSGIIYQKMFSIDLWFELSPYSPVIFGLFLSSFPKCFLCCLLFLVTPWFAVAVQPCVKWIQIKRFYSVTMRKREFIIGEFFTKRICLFMSGNFYSSISHFREFEWRRLYFQKLYKNSEKTYSKPTVKWEEVQIWLIKTFELYLKFSQITCR